MRAVSAKVMSKSTANRLALCAPLVVGLVLLAPRLSSPQFGFLDDGLTIRSAPEISRHPGLALRLNADTGRFIPAYWLYQAVIYTIGWAEPVVFFAANYVLLAIIASLLVWLVRLRGGTWLQAGASGIFFVLSGAVIESFYTLSKAEPLQVAALLLGLVAVPLMTRARHPVPRVALFLAAVAAFLAANCAKETTVALIPITVGWLVLGYFRLTAKDDLMDRTAREIYVGAVLVTSILYFALRFAFVTSTVTAGSYTRAYRLEVSRILGSASTWTAWGLRDFPYLFPLGIFAIWSLRRKDQPQAVLLADALIWMAGWVTVFLPWQSVLEYYLLPFAAGCAMFCGVIFGQLCAYCRRGNEAAWARRILITTVVLLGITQLNNYTGARFQLAADAANSDLLEFLGGLPNGSRVYVNVPEPNEYVYEIGVQLAELKHRGDIQVGYFHYQVPAVGFQNVFYYVVTPIFNNQTTPLPRYGIYESGAKLWQDALGALIGHRAKPVFQTERNLRLMDFGIQRVLCPLVRGGLYCYAPRPLIDTRRLTTGWRVYNISSSAERADLPGVFRSDGTWALRLPSGTLRQIRFGQPGDIPVPGDWDGDGRTEIGVFRPDNVTWYLDGNFDGRPDREFRFPGMELSDVPLAGDWDGNGTATPGYFRASDASWHFRNSFSAAEEDWPVIRLGMPGDVPLVGDWDGGGRTSIGIYRRSTGEITLMKDIVAVPELTTFNVGAGRMVVAGDWNGLGVRSIAVVTGGTWSPKLNCNCNPSNAPANFEFDGGTGVPLAGKWRLR